MSDGPGAGTVIAGIFLILFGLCITLLGGGCTLMLLSVASGAQLTEAAPMLLVSLLVLGGGLTVIWAGIRLMRGPSRNG